MRWSSCLQPIACFALAPATPLQQCGRPLLLRPRPLAFAPEEVTTTTSDSIVLKPVVEEAVALFSLGCFWAPSEDFKRVPGVLEVSVGYAGGPSSYAWAGELAPPPPNYDTVCSGSAAAVETVQVKYDKAQCSYRDLLETFFESHDSRVAIPPKKVSVNTIEAHNKNARLLLDDGSSSSVVPEALSQYASVIWPASDDEEAAALKCVERLWQEASAAAGEGSNDSGREGRGRGPATVVRRLPEGRTEEEFFFPAEAYHQEFWPKARVRFGVLALLVAAQYAEPQLSQATTLGQLLLLGFILFERSEARLARLLQ
jgi:peptide methionine sulfoxide reductase MsrA